MRPRLLVSALAVLAVLGLGTSCPQKKIRIVTPVNNSTVTTPSFAVQVEVAGAGADLGNVEITLNGQPVAAVQAPAGTFSATIDPGDPLLDDNVLHVVVPFAGGTEAVRESHFVYGPPKSRARVLTNPADLLTGPLAQNRLGDYLLENGEARFVIQAPGGRDLHSVGQYGGNLIDAELVAKPGTDSFFEIQPSFNIETVINAQTIEIVNDGQNGLPAVIRTCGPDDLIDYINASSQVASLGLSIPGVIALIDDNDQDVEGCTEYSLTPSKRYVRMDTTVFNNSPDPLTLYVGDYVNAMGTLEQWTNTSTPSIGMGEVLATPITQVLAFMGFGTNEGVDYGVVPVPFTPTPIPTSSSFTTSGVSFYMHGNALVFVLGAGSPPTFEVAAGGSNVFTRYFAVGDGSVANSIEVETEVKGIAAGTLSGCVTSGGNPVPGARVAVGPVASGKISRLVSHFVTDASGCYGAKITAGSWSVAAAKTGYPYEGGGVYPVLHAVAIPANGNVVQDVALPATGRLHVEIVDENGAPMPGRVSVVGIDPSPEPVLVTSIISAMDTRTGLFNDTKDTLRTGLVAMTFAGADGVAELDVEPGSYEVVVSRGMEYSVHREPISSVAGAVTNVSAQIAPVLDTTGFISSDFHVHMLNSPDSRIAMTTRALSYAAEGVDNIIATDHDAITDLNPTIAALGLSSFVHSTIGEEITSFDYGHYNAYPQAVDPTRVSGGSTDWAGAAPPGQDFPSQGNYVLTPAQIDAAAVGKPQNAGLETVVQINHIDSHFAPLQIDTALEPPASLLPDPTVFRLDPGVGNFFHAFQALELWNGASVGKQAEFLVDRVGIWMNLLNQGIISTAIADTDTHTVVDLETAGARTWTPSSTDAPNAIVDNEIGLAVKAHKGLGGQGCFAKARIVDTETSAQADLELGGTTLVTATNGDVDLEIEVQAPIWAPYDKIEIYRNAQTQVTGTSGGTPVLYTALPTQTLTLGAADFTRSVVNVYPAVAGAERYETTKTLTLSGLSADEWVVVMVRGTQGVSPSMFPMFVYDAASGQSLADLMTNTIAESGVRALCFTNALFVDADGNSVFDPPGVQLAP